MRHPRIIQPIALLAAIAASALLATPAFADSGAVDGSSSASVATTTTTSDTSSVKPSESPSTPASTTSTSTTTSSSTPSTTSSTPTTSSSSSCSDSSSSGGCTTTTTPVESPTTPEVKTPTTPTVDAPADDAPGGGDLPFTGPGDVLLAIVLALLAGSGGILFMAGAAGREQLDGLNRRTMDSPSGFKLAYRELLKQQVGRD